MNQQSLKSSRYVAINIWKKIYYKNSRFNNEINKSMEFNKLSKRDRSFIYHLISVCMRRNNQIKHIYKKYPNRPINEKLKNLHSILTLATAELIWLNVPSYAVLNSYVELIKQIKEDHFSKFINLILRKIANNKEELRKEIKPDTINLPKWMFLEWSDSYDKNKISEIIKFCMLEPSLDIVCSQKINIQKKQALIQQLDGIEVLPNLIRSFYRGTISDLIGYQEGLWWVQDAGAFLQFEILQKKIESNLNASNLKILDLCCAPGGKTFQMLDKGYDVTSVDNNLNRLKIMNKSLKRLKLNGKTICQDVMNLNFSKKFDVIVLDAPCSSTGTIRKNPDIFLRNKKENYEKLIQIQNNLLHRSSKLLKKDGLIMYIVCSLEKKEGEKLINKFCKDNENFQILPIKKLDTIINQNNIISEEGFMRILPSSISFSNEDKFNGTDGFFSAILKKVN